MEKKVLGGAVIGYGGMGNFHANQMLKEEIPGIELIGVYDIDEERQQVARDKGIEAFESREALEHYAVHPLHQEAKGHFFHLLDSRTAADYEV